VKGAPCINLPGRSDYFEIHTVGTFKVTGQTQKKVLTMSKKELIFLFLERLFGTVIKIENER
jgi:hypothetical protein